MIPGIVAGAALAQAAVEPTGLVFVGGRTQTYSFNGLSATIPLTSLIGGIGSAPGSGDVVIIAAHVANVPADINFTMSGWTEVADTFINETYRSNFACYYKVMGETPDVSASLDLDGNNIAHQSLVVAVHVWRGADNATPMDVTPTVASGSNSGRPNPPAITPVTEGAVIIAAGGSSSAYGTTQVLSPADLSNFVTVSANQDPVTNSRTSVGIGSIPWAGAGAVDPAQWDNVSDATSRGWGACTIALKPAA